jgi:hypothetical protein
MRTLKTLSIAILAIFLFSNAQCNKKIKLVKTIDGATATFIATPQSAGNYDYSQLVKMDMEAELKKFDISLSSLTAATIESATITLIDSTATPVTFDIMDNISLELGNTSVPLRKLVWKDPVPHTGLTTLQADADTEFDVLPLVKSNEVNYHFTGKLNAALDHPITITIAIKWHVTAEI